MEKNEDKKVVYSYQRHMGKYNIYREEKDGVFTLGTKVDERFSKEEAEKEVYRLNGWKLKNK